MSKVHLAQGAALLLGERPWRVASFDGRAVTLDALDNDDAQVTLTVPELVSSAGLRGLAAEPQTGPSRAALVEGLSNEQLQQAVWRRQHVMEVVHGHPGGEWSDPLDEPREGYDPRTTTKGERIALKARELKAAGIAKASERSVRRWIDDYRKEGLLGLVDERHTRLRRDRAQGSAEVLAILDEIVSKRATLSTARLSNLYADLKRELRNRYPDHRLVGLRDAADGKVLRVPSQPSFYRLIRTRYRGSYLTGESKARESQARMGPVALNPFHATRSGEVVQIDSTKLDLLALDRATGEIVRPELTLAVDAFDHSVRAARVAAGGTRGVDVALMVYDMLCPVPWRPEWGPECAWNYHGIPERLVIDLAAERLAGRRPARSPFGQPQTIVCDRGRIYLSKTFFGACEQFGISVQPAPPRTPNYKGVVERAFDTFTEQALERLPGHVGRGTHHRGSAVDSGPMLFLDQVEALVIDWAVTYYHRRRHTGCELPEAPQVKVTPNQMFEYSVARSGFITVPPSPERMVACLPSRMVVIQNYGVNLDGLRYYHSVLDAWLVRRSPWDPDSGKPKHRVHYDPRDLSKIWFYEPDSDEWVPLRRRNAMHPDVPFNDAALAWVKRIMASDGYQRPDVDLTAQYLDAFLERQLAGQTHPQERRLVARMLDDARAASKLTDPVAQMRVVEDPYDNPVADELSVPAPCEPGKPGTGVGVPARLRAVLADGDDGPLRVKDEEDDVEPLPVVDDDSFGAAS